ncbi:MAG: thioredoxin family protein [Anaerolineales bacterium]|nr:thioredoxin family protein [Anaerolineales bacterium]
MNSTAKWTCRRPTRWKINADEHPKLLKEMKIYGIPTIMAFREGREFVRKTGVQPAKYYFDLFQSLATGGAAPVKSLAPLERWMRLAAGGILLWLGYSQANWIMVAIAAVILFSAVYDRCPIWKAITARLSKRA